MKYVVLNFHFFVLFNTSFFLDFYLSLDKIGHENVTIGLFFCELIFWIPIEML